MYKADSGEDISNSYDDLAAAFNVPRQVVENYVSKAQAGEAAEAPTLTVTDEAELKDMVGGDDAFTQLSEWAQAIWMKLSWTPTTLLSTATTKRPLHGL